MSSITASSRRGNNDDRGGSSSFLSFSTASRVLSACIIIVSLQNFVHLSRLTSSSTVHSPSFNEVVNKDITIAPALFTPEEFQAGRIEKYINQPTIYTPQRDDKINQLISKPIPPPSETLLHQAPLPPSNNAILGLASYPQFQEGWVRLVGSLRRNGYEGHIILGVHPEIPHAERDYLDKMGVTYYAVETTNCTSNILPQNSPQTSNTVRAKCSKGLEHFKLEWGRYEMARRWLHACTSCTGWSMVIDTRDIFFQADPFVSLGSVQDTEHDLMFVEEVAQYSKTLNDTSRAINIGASQRYRYFTVPCYGRDQVAPQRIIDRPMLCSGTVIGTRSGMHRFLTVLVDEFNNNNQKGVDECRSPHTTDQWTMNYLYYRGDFGFPHRTKTLPWGTGPVLTVGKPCATQLYNNATGEMEHVTSLKDMMLFDNDSDLILNPHEKKGSAAYVAPTIHQWDRCLMWISPWFSRHEDLFAVDDGGVEWAKG